MPYPANTMEPMSVIESDGSSGDLKPASGCSRVEVSRNVSFVFFLAGFVMCVLAFGTPFWFKEGDYSYGLWNTCARDFFSWEVECERIDVGRPSQLTFEMRALQTNMTLGLLSGGISLLLYIVWFCKKARKGTLAFAAVGTHAFAGIAQMTAVAFFGTYYSYEISMVSWSFVLACVSAGIQTLTGLITLFVLPCQR